MDRSFDDFLTGDPRAFGGYLVDVHTCVEISFVFLTTISQSDRMRDEVCRPHPLSKK